MEEENNDGGAVIITNVYGDICIRKERKKRHKMLMQDMFYDYAKNTTLHGLSYTTKSGVTLPEKIFWLITFVVSICLCCYLISNVWIKWKTSPVIVTISETLVPVRKVPFPSVTICPQSKIKVSVYNYTDEGIQRWASLNDSEFDYVDFLDVYVEIEKHEHLSLVCQDWRLYYQLKNSTGYKRNVTASLFDLPVAQYIIDVAPKKEDIFVACIWRGKTDKYCAQTVTEVITSEGLCYNINSLAAFEILQEDNNVFINATKHAVNWTIRDGYSYFGPEVYPAPGKEFGASPDLEIILQDNKTERDPTCNKMNIGFSKIYVQHPTDLPQASLHYYAVRNGEVSSVALSFNIINTPESLKKYSAEIRQCYFPEERYLKYFKIYTLSNCMMECLANITFEKCGCAAFYMPRLNDTRICGYLRENVNCVNGVREELVKREASESNDACRCLPSCYSIEYEAEILKTAFNFENMIEEYNITYDSSVQFSKLEMFFKGSRFVSMHRSELFGTTDFFANIGGLLGLFLGFSFLSVIELLYYLTLRLFCALWKDVQQEKIQRQNTLKFMPQKF